MTPENRAWLQAHYDEGHLHPPAEHIQADTPSPILGLICAALSGAVVGVVVILLLI